MSITRFPLMGPAAKVFAAARAVAEARDRFAILLEGDPGIGKTQFADELALAIAGSEHAIEVVNGQSLDIETVRGWRRSAMYGNLFSSWTVKRVDEIDQASSSAMAELLTYLDYLRPQTAVIVTTNEYAKLRALCKGRLETRFVRFHVDAPSIDDTTAYLRRHYHVSTAHARQLALGAVPEGCLPSVGCNLRAAINDAIGLQGAQKARKAVAT